MEHNYQKSPSLTPGTTYLSQHGFPVIPLKALPGTRALFVAEEFYPHSLCSLDLWAHKYK